MNNRKVYRRENYLKNREKSLKQSRDWRKRHPRKDKQNARNYYQKNKERILKRNKEWRKNNLEKYKAQQKNWVKKNPKKIKKIQRRYHLKHREQRLGARKEWSLKNKDRERDKWRRFYWSNRERCLLENKKWRKRNKDKVKEHSEARTIMKKYKTFKETFDWIIKYLEEHNRALDEREKAIMELSLKTQTPSFVKNLKHLKIKAKPLQNPDAIPVKRIKACYYCLQFKPAEMFRSQGYMKNGKRRLSHKCRECFQKETAERFVKRIEKF